MAQEKFKRKLTTILSADVDGCTRPMGEDEAATIRTLEQYKKNHVRADPSAPRPRVDSAGDNHLAESGSVVDAVQCAVATKKKLQARSTEFPETFSAVAFLSGDMKSLHFLGKGDNNWIS
jgi:adenylate cyclase